MMPPASEAVRMVVDTLPSSMPLIRRKRAWTGWDGRRVSMDRQLGGWIARWNKARHEPNPLVEELADWLQKTQPPSPPATLLHNDWRLDNMAVDPDDPGVCVAVYDWDMCTRGDPFADVGTLMGCWFDPDEDSIFLDPMPTRTPGFMTRGEAISRYGEKSGRDVSGMHWYVVFGTFKMGVILQQIYIRWLRGQTQDERFATMGHDAARLFELAAARRSTRDVRPVVCPHRDGVGVNRTQAGIRTEGPLVSRLRGTVNVPL